MSTEQLVQPKKATTRVKKGAACKDCSRRKRKCHHVQLQDQQIGDRLGCSSALILHTPTCSETRLCNQLGETLKSLRVEHTWLNMVPCRLGHSDALDNAIQAVVTATPFSLKADGLGIASSLPDYVRTVHSIREAMAAGDSSLSDNVLMSVALLSVVEALMQSDIAASLAHWRALGSVLLSRPAESEQSEISRAILFHIRNQTFHVPCARGIASPFDHPRWYNLQPASSLVLPKCVTRIKFLSNQLLIRLPRLIAIVRCLRTGVDVEANQSLALHLVEELDELQDDMAESGMLHRVKVIKTTNEEDAAFVPVSFDFENLFELEAAVVYWKAHMVLKHLKLKLLEVCEKSTSDFQEIRGVTERMACNIMMSHQQARGRPQHAHSRGMVAMGTAWSTVWALWSDREEFRGIERDRWREWTLQRFNEAIRVWGFQVSEKDLDETSDLFAGGPLVGILVSAYRT